MNKYFLFLILYLLPISIHSQVKTYFYKLEKVTDANMHVKGGQFITFQGSNYSTCYESDCYGISVGHGKLIKKVGSSNIYFGTSYWGENTSFCFSSDFNTFFIKTSEGVTYYYKKAPVPEETYTCSLIRTSSNSSSGTTNYAPTHIYNNNQGNPTYSGGGSNGNTSTVQRTPQKRWHNVTKTVDCNLCHRSGRCQTCNGKGWYQGTYGPIDCPNCYGYKTGKCSHCQGNGTVQKIEQVFD